MPFEIHSFNDCQYIVSVNLRKILDLTGYQYFCHQLEEVFQDDEDMRNICYLENDYLAYLSETLLPKKIDKTKKKVLLVFGNPASHSIQNGMFYFSKRDHGKHPMWTKLADAGLLPPIKPKYQSDLSPLEKRRVDAKIIKTKILEGNTSEKYQIGLTTFYSFPTTVSPGSNYKNVRGISKIFRNCISQINSFETNRLLGYSFSKDATIVFVQKSTYSTFEEQNNDKVNDKVAKVIYWPAVSQREGFKKTGAYLAQIL